MRTGTFVFAISFLLAACSNGGGGDSDSLFLSDNPPTSPGGTGTTPIKIPVQPTTKVSRYSVTFLPSDDLSMDRLPYPAAINNQGQVVGDFLFGS